MSLEPPSGRKQHKSRRNVAPKGLLLVGAHDTFATLNCTGQMGEAVMTKGNAEKTTGPWTSNVSLPAYLGEWVIRLHGPPGTWVTHVLQELPCWCLQSASSCNYILHLLRMSRLDCKSCGKHDCRFLEPSHQWEFLSGTLFPAYTGASPQKSQQSQHGDWRQKRGFPLQRKESRQTSATETPRNAARDLQGKFFSDLSLY